MTRDGSARRWPAYCLIALMLVPQLAASQQTDPIAAGARMRVTELSVDRPMRYVGRLVALTTDSLYLTDPYATKTTFANARLSRVEASVGKRRHVLSGLGIGLVTGTLSGAAAGAMIGGNLGGDGEAAFAAALVIGVYGGAFGTVVGGVVGALVRTDIWEVVHDSRWRVGMRTEHGHGLALTRTF